MSFLVHAAGTYSLLVDGGRPRSRSLGVPVGGAADRAALALGNALLGNPPLAPALEVTLAGPTLEATDHHACVVWGAPFAVWVNKQSQPVGETFTVRPGDLLTIGTTEVGLRAYLCVRGGFQAKEVLGSRSALEPLQARQELACAPSTVRRRFCQLTVPGSEYLRRLRVLRGSHAGLFASDLLVNREYTVSPNSNRMGLRLAGEPLKRESGELLSAPVCPGTVQVTNDGQLIVLGVDAQTIGGYPRIAQVVAADLDKLAQLRSDDRIRFEWVDLATALELFRVRRLWLNEWVTRLRHSLF